MRHSLVLALAYLRHHAGRTVPVVAALGLIIALPVAVAAVFGAAQARLGDRAAATPLVIGARGSATDLVLSALTFTGTPPEPVSMAAVDAVWDSGLAQAIPLHLGFSAGGAPIVGTTLDYFALRGLAVAQGRGLAELGEAVLGADAARRLGLGPGDRVTSAPVTLFDIAGSYPLRMTVVGVLAPTGGPDDGAVLVDIKTAWVIAGIGHGHDPAAAGPALRTYAEITPENIDSFHFHGDPAQYPVTAVIVAPTDARAGTILRGRYLAADRPVQIAEPAEVIGRLQATLGAIERVVQGAVALGAVAAGLAIGLVLYLSLQLRRDEIATMVRLGAARGTVAGLVLAELGLVLALGAALAGALLALASPWLEPAVTALMRGG